MRAKMRAEWMTTLSTGEGGKYIYCDGEGCKAKALAVVALHVLLNTEPDPALSTKGWLFVMENDRTRHFCPQCAAHYLNDHSSNEHHADRNDFNTDTNERRSKRQSALK